MRAERNKFKAALRHFLNASNALVTRPSVKFKFEKTGNASVRPVPSNEYQSGGQSNKHCYDAKR